MTNEREQDPMSLPQVAEQAGFGGEMGKAAARLLESLLGPAFRTGGGMLGDALQMFRWRQRIRILAKAEELVRAHGAAAMSVAPEFLIPYLERIGDVTDPTLQDMWARLLATTMTQGGTPHPLFMRVLQELSPDEARILAAVRDHDYPFIRQSADARISGVDPLPTPFGSDIVEHKFPADVVQSPELLGFYVHHLFSLQVIGWRYSRRGSQDRFGAQWPLITECSLSLSVIGTKLADACMPAPKTPP